MTASDDHRATKDRFDPPPLVSVVIPSLNRSERLLRLLDALSIQEGDVSFEVVVADDGSTDRTVELVQAAVARLPFPLRVLPWPTRTGAGPARNRGWKAAHGRLILFVDDDCVPERGWLDALVAALQSQDVVVGRTMPPADQLDRIGPFTSYMDISSKDCYPTCNIGYRREVLEALGGFDEERFKLHNGEDTDLGLRAEKAAYRTSYTSEAIVYHDVRPSEFLPYFKRVRDREALVALVARHPEARRRLSVGWWLRASDKAVPLVWAAGARMAFGRRDKTEKCLTIAVVLFYLWQFRHSYYRSHSKSELARAIPLGFLADTWSLVVMIRGSIRYRTVFL